MTGISREMRGETDVNQPRLSKALLASLLQQLLRLAVDVADAHRAGNIAHLGGDNVAGPAKAPGGGMQPINKRERGARPRGMW